MEVDNDLDGQLLQQFSSMGTTDKEVLIAEFQKLLGNQLNPDGCAFFLDMNNWNLQAAICSYYDFEQPTVKLPCMALVRDATVGEGESISPSTKFYKTWKVQNTGDESWPPACVLKFLSGDQFGHQDRIVVDGLSPGQCTEISLEMTSPPTTGIYQGQWRMSTPTGLYFGEVIWVILQVEEAGLLGVTQQMSRFASEFAHSPSQQTCLIENPFASPVKSTDSSFLSPGKVGSSSPTPSLIAQHGSLPNSPSVLDNGFSPFSSASQVRTALFQNSPPSDSSNTQASQLTDQQDMDSGEML